MSKTTKKTKKTPDVPVLLDQLIKFGTDAIFTPEERMILGIHDGPVCSLNNPDVKQVILLTFDWKVQYNGSQNDHILVTRFTDQESCTATIDSYYHTLVDVISEVDPDGDVFLDVLKSRILSELAKFHTAKCLDKWMDLYDKIFQKWHARFRRLFALLSCYIDTDNWGEDCSCDDVDDDCSRCQCPSRNDCSNCPYPGDESWCDHKGDKDEDSDECLSDDKEETKSDDESAISKIMALREKEIENTVHIGKLLIEAKKQIPNDEDFQKWIDENLDIDPDYVNRYIEAGETGVGFDPVEMFIEDDDEWDYDNDEEDDHDEWDDGWKHIDNNIESKPTAETSSKSFPNNIGTPEFNEAFAKLHDALRPDITEVQTGIVDINNLVEQKFKEKIIDNENLKNIEKIATTIMENLNAWRKEDMVDRNKNVKSDPTPVASWYHNFTERETMMLESLMRVHYLLRFLGPDNISNTFWLIREIMMKGVNE